MCDRERRGVEQFSVRVILVEGTEGTSRERVRPFPCRRRLPLWRECIGLAQ